MKGKKNMGNLFYFNYFLKIKLNICYNLKSPSHNTGLKFSNPARMQAPDEKNIYKKIKIN